MKYYKINVPKMLLNNGQIGEYGQIINENDLIDKTDQLKLEYLVEVDGPSEETEKEETVEKKGVVEIDGNSTVESKKEETDETEKPAFKAPNVKAK